MNLIADESVDRQIVDELRRSGHKVVYIAEVDPSISDNEVFDIANKINALLVTADKDFGEIVFRDGRIASKGVILLRLAGLSPTLKSGIVLNAIKENEPILAGSFTVISPGSVRRRA